MHLFRVVCGGGTELRPNAAFLHSPPCEEEVVWLGLAQRELSPADTSLRSIGYHCLLHLGFSRL